ncbi:hypothetical protein QYE76_069205 [Lolium multiflorum]|uniref:GTD-binding domain-containing protein n=1 Tax=Lolium multiflorum TaxID=4521 RepID=A0AAD8SFU4_LOLMU|nr:hypothetical protein QYE76_069205 [Lolium multiflorum]
MASSSASASGPSRYASALHRRTHRVTSALAHAALEWTLIALLLINGLLTHAVARFAAYFGLSPPCLLCARVDRLLGAPATEEDGDEGDARWLRGVLCGAHAAEISGMGYCLRHRRLVAEAADMCEGCISSWKKQSRNETTVCSCCKILVEVPSRALEDTHPREDPAAIHHQTAGEEETEDQGYVLLDQEDHEDEEEEQAEAEEREQQNEEEVKAAPAEEQVIARGEESMARDDRVKAMFYWLLWMTIAAGEDESVAQGEEVEDDRLVPVVALDGMTVADDSDAGEGHGEMARTDDERDPDDLDTAVLLDENRMLASSVATASAMIDNSVPRAEELILQDASVEIGTEEEDIAVPQVPEDGNKSAEVETNCEVSIGSDICEQEQDGHAVPFQELVALEELFSPLEYADDLTLPPESFHGSARAESSETEQRLDYLSNDQNENDQDRAPGTPTYSFTSQNSGKRFLLERKLSLSLSMDGSVSSEFECGDPPTIDQLKSTLQTERKALSAMYAELEEERNAAAIATNQTMAMINRLQEEKAAMQMEALQYQRMMEEQSEYDQEAMQLLTELVTKREREKQELETELELCRQKLLHYEDKERRRMATFKENGNGTSESSSDEDSDEHSDDECELGESPNGSGNLHSSPDAALSPMTGQENTSHLVELDDSLTYFEMERLSILDELKTLEERLFTLEDDDTNDTNVASDRSSDDFVLSTDGVHSPENGLTGNKAKFEGRSSVSRGKSLLPLFDAVGEENCDRTSAAQADDSTNPIAVFVKEKERLAIIEEVDHVYERLQALEADKEFLRHCIKSLKTGDKGMYLLQEILQHLRELRNVELHVKNAGGAIAGNSA